MSSPGSRARVLLFELLASLVAVGAGCFQVWSLGYAAFSVNHVVGSSVVCARCGLWVAFLIGLGGSGVGTVGALLWTFVHWVL